MISVRMRSFLTLSQVLREYIVSPILVHTMPSEQYQRRRHQLGIGQNSSETKNSITYSSGSQFSSIRSQKTLDSALSGMATGGLLRGLKCMSIFILCHDQGLNHEKLVCERSFLEQSPLVWLPHFCNWDTTNLTSNASS